MFKRATAILIVCIFALSGIWGFLLSEPQSSGRGFFALKPILQPLHLTQDLGGMWTSYSSLRDAWFQEQKKSGNNGRSRSAIFGSRQILIPSDEKVGIIAKSFQLQNPWSSRQIVLVIEGVQGRAEIYLNGADETHRIGVIEENHKSSILLIESNRLNYSGDNVLLINMTPSSLADNQVFAGWRRHGGMITGSLKIEVRPDVSFRWETLSVVHNKDQSEVIIEVDVDYPLADPQALWHVKGVLLKENSVVAEGSISVRSDLESGQRVTLVLRASGLVLWSMKRPTLYDLRLSVGDGNDIIDSLQIPVGFSQTERTLDGRLTLNGEELRLRGIRLSCEEAAELMSDDRVDEFLSEQLNMGINIIYFADYVDEYWLFAADRAGMGIWYEMPVFLTEPEKLPVRENVESMLSAAGRHPSLLAWTALRGGETSHAATVAYMEEVARLAEPGAVFEIAYRDDLRRHDSGRGDAYGQGYAVLVPDGGTLSGPWGEVEASDPREKQIWAFEIVAAAICLSFLLFLEIMNFRTRGLPYAYLMSQDAGLKRWADGACWMRFFTFVGGMAVLSALCVHVLLSIPAAANPWLDYPWVFLARLQDVSPYLLWVTLIVLFITIRLLQLGLASSGFQHRPEPLKLICWLEQKGGWRWIGAIGWVLVSFGAPLWIGIGLYAVVLIMSWPARLRVYRRIGAKASYLWILPFVIFVGALGYLVYHSREIMFLMRVL